MPNGDALRAAIPEIMERCSSIEELLESEPRIRQGYDELLQTVRSARIADLDAALRVLLDLEHWQQLANTPQKLDQELNAALRAVKSAIKKTFQVQPHRPVKNQERDLRISRLRQQNPSKSYGEIADMDCLGSY